MAGEGTYIYCIMEGDQGETFGPLGIGGRGDQLRTIHYQDIGAVVSQAAVRRYPVSRENSLAHERAIEAVFKGHSVLPVRFCTIAENEAKVRTILEREYTKFKELLERMRGKVELGLKAIFHEKLIYRDILDGSKEISRRKAAVAGVPQPQAQRQLMEIGRMVEVALETEKARVREEILEALKGACHDFRLTHRILGERMIMNAAFLVDRAQEAEFDRRMDGLAERYGERVRLKYVSGFPPFNFVCLTIKLE